MDPSTDVVRLGRPPAQPGAGVNPPVVLNSTFHQGGDLVYGRQDNPTWHGIEEVVGHLEGGDCLVFSSGLAAISAVLESLPVPGRVVVAGDAYTGTRQFLSDVAGRGRLRFRTVDVTDTAGVLAVCAEMVDTPGRPSGADGAFGSGGILWLESPTNPMLSIADLGALSSGAHELGLDVVVDNTFASPLLQHPLALGADVVVHSATKVIAGHSDVLLGLAVTRRPEVLEALRVRRTLHGAIAGPWEAWLALRGVRTMALRVSRGGASAGELASRLSSHPGVTSVRYPGLASHPGHDLAARQMTGFGTMLSFEIKGSADDAEAFASRLRLITVATSLGGVESLIERRARLVAEDAVPPSLMRLSVGIEDVEDLWADLDQALAGL
jgi:cystathionine gamma-synthase